MPLDVPFGVRVDGRFATDGSSERSLMVSVQLDLPGVIAGIVLVGALLHAVTNGH